MKNLKSVILAETIKYFKQSTVSINKLLTKEHHNIIKQFLAFKQRTAEEIEHARQYMLDLHGAEQREA